MRVGLSSYCTKPFLGCNQPGFCCRLVRRVSADHKLHRRGYDAKTPSLLRSIVVVLARVLSIGQQARRVL
jgi:hypothetical protein